MAEVGSHIPRSLAGHLVERGARRMPCVGLHLVTDQRDVGAVGDRGGEEPRVEPTRQAGRRDPARQRDKQVRPQAEVERFHHRRERALDVQELGARDLERTGVGGAAVRPVGEQDAGLLERLADRGDVRGDRLGRGEVATERLGRFVRRDRRPRDEPRVRVRRVDAPAREHVHVGRERHR